MKNMVLKSLPTAALCAAALCAAPVWGQVDGIATAQLVTGGQMEDGRLLGALQIVLTPEWKTYWRSPGQGGGIPPQFDWSGSQNLADVALMWPIPEVWTDASGFNIGYHDILTVPVAVTPIDINQPVTLDVRVDLGVCKDICVPAQLDLTGTLLPQDVAAPMPASNTVPVIAPVIAPEITAALQNLPTPADQIDGLNWTCSAAPIKDGLQVTASITMPQMGADETVVIEHNDGEIWVSAATMLRAGDTLRAVADLVPPQAAPFDLDGSQLRLTVLAAGRAVDMKGCVLN